MAILFAWFFCVNANKIAKRAYNGEKIVFDMCQRKQRTLQIKNESLTTKSLKSKL